MIVYYKLTPSIIVVVEHVTIVAPRLCVFKCLASCKKQFPFNPLIWWVELKK
jgi:hypothetical protein